MIVEQTEQALQVKDNTVQLDPAILAGCIHCGLCLPACPTYVSTGREMESPRGRIYIVNEWTKGNIELDSDALGHLDSCLGCLGCETACPSGVKYEAIINAARPHIAQARPAASRQFMRYIFAKVLPDYGLLRFLGGAIDFWQKLGGKQMMSMTPLINKLFAKIIEWQDLLPPMPKFIPLPKQSWKSGEKQGSVNLFSGCVMDVFYNHVNHAAIRLLCLQRQIVQVPEQTCCGALAFHAGESDIAIDLAKKNIELFESTKGPIIVTAAGCGAMLKGYGELLASDNEWATRAHDFSQRVEDVTQFLASHEFAGQPKVMNNKVAYHAACHLSHAQGVRGVNEKLLECIPGVEPVKLVDAEQCCGSAGIYNLLHANMSEKILERKVECIAQTGADTVVTTNPGCILQIEAGLRQAQLPVKVVHTVQLLDEAYAAEDSI